MTTQTFETHFVRSDSRLEKLVRSKVFWICFLGFVFSFPIYKSLNRTLPPALPVLYQLPDYSFVNENGEVFGSKQLEDKVYIASFFFTSCPSICPKIMDKMKIIQHRIRGVGNRMKIVSFTVDPTHDSSEVLFKNARKYSANPYVWNFLTASEKDMKSLLVDGFKVPMGDKENVELYDIAHSEKIVLVDGKGQIRGYYSLDDDSVNRLMIDVGLLINREFQSGTLLRDVEGSNS